MTWVLKPDDEIPHVWQHSGALQHFLCLPDLWRVLEDNQRKERLVGLLY